MYPLLQLGERGRSGLKISEKSLLGGSEFIFFGGGGGGYIVGGGGGGGILLKWGHVILK